MQFDCSNSTVCRIIKLSALCHVFVSHFCCIPIMPKASYVWAVTADYLHLCKNYHINALWVINLFIKIYFSVKYRHFVYLIKFLFSCLYHLPCIAYPATHSPFGTARVCFQNSSVEIRVIYLKRTTMFDNLTLLPRPGH